jgi:hypothetical protein
MADIARPTKIWDQALNDWVYLAGVVDTTKSYTYTADQTFPGITATSYNGGSIVGRNKILNGDFSIWQRGNSFSLSTGVVTFASDRWFWVMPGGTTVSRQSFSPGNSPVSGYEGQYYVNTTLTANGQNYEMGQRIEDVRTFAGQRVTLSFWARSTAGAQPLGYALFQYFGTGGSPSSMVQATQVTGSGPYTPTSTWQRYSYTFDLPSISGKTIGTNNDSYLLVRPMQFTATTTNTSVDIWGVQLESGSVATPFHTATANKQAELAACQRYYIRYSGGATNAILGGFGGWITTTIFRPVLQLPVSMRIAPTSVDYSSIAVREFQSASAVNATAVSIDQTSPQQVSLNLTTTARTIGYIGFIQVDNANVNGYLGLSAEL